MNKFLFLTDDQKNSIARANSQPDVSLQGATSTSALLSATNVAPQMKLTGLTDEEKAQRQEVSQRLKETNNPSYDGDKFRFLDSIKENRLSEVSLDPEIRSKQLKDELDRGDRGNLPGMSVEEAAEDGYVKQFFELDSDVMEGHFSQLSRRADAGEEEAQRKINLIRRAAPGLQDVLNTNQEEERLKNRSTTEKAVDLLAGGATRSFAGIRNFVGIDFSIGPLDLEIVQSRADQILDQFEDGELNEEQFEEQMQIISKEAGLNFDDDTGDGSIVGLLTSEASRKTYANFGEAGVDALTLGGGKAITTGAKVFGKAGIKTASKLGSKKAAEVVSRLAIRSAGEDASKVVVKKLLRNVIKDSVKNTAAEGGAIGALQSFQGEEAPDFKQVAASTAIGAGAGAVFGAAIPVAGAVAGKGFAKAKDRIKPAYAFFEDFITVPEFATKAGRAQAKEVGKDLDEILKDYVEKRAIQISGDIGDNKLATDMSNELQKNLRKDVISLGGISDSTVEDLPKFAKRKKGQSADRIIQELNSSKGYTIQSEDELVEMLLRIDEPTTGLKINKKDATEQAIIDLTEGNSEEADIFRMTVASGKEMLDDIAAKDARGELADGAPKLGEALPEGSELTANANLSPGNVKQRINRTTDARQDTTGTVNTTQKQLMKNKLRDEARGANEGFAEGRRTMKEELMEKVFDKRQRVAEIKSELVRYVQENVDPAQRGKLLARVRSAKTRLDLEKAVNFADKVQLAANKKKLIEGLTKNFKKVQTKSKNGLTTGKLTADAQIAIDQARTITKMSRESAQEEIQSIIEEFSGQTLPLAAKQRIELLNTFADVKNMNVSQLSTAFDNLDQIKEFGKTNRLAKDQARKLRIDKVKEDAADIISGGKGIDETGQTPSKDNGIVAGFFRKIDNWQQGWDTMLDKLSRFDKGTNSFGSKLNKFGEIVHASRAKQVKGNREMFAVVQDSYASIFGTGNKRKLKRIMQENTTDNVIVVRTADGKSAEKVMSRNQAYKKYMEWQDPTLRNRFDEMGWDQNTIDDLTDYMGPKLKEWADYQLDVFYPEYYKTINKVYRDKFGVDLPFNSKYSPIISEADFMAGGEGASMLQKEVKAYASTKPGALKKRASKAPLALNDGDQVLIRHITQMEHFKAWENSIGEVRAVFNDSKIRAGIKQYHGDDALVVVDKMIEDMATDGSNRATSWKLVDGARRRFTQSALGLNPGVFLKQLSSIPAFTTEMPAGKWASGVADFFTDPVGNSKILMKSEAMQARYDVGFTRDMVDVMGKDTVKKLSGSQTFLNKLMFMTKAGDKAAIMSGGWSVYKHELAEGISKGLSHADAEKGAFKKFEAAVRRTQQSGNVEDLGHFQRGGSLPKLFTMFQTAPNAYYRITSRSLRNIKEGRGDLKTNLKNLYVSWVLLPTAFQWVADGGEYKADSQARAAIMGPAGGILAVGQLLDAGSKVLFGEDSYDNPGVPGPILTGAEAVETFKKMVDTIKQEDITSAEVWDLIDDMGDTAGPFTGLPAASVSRAVEGVQTVIGGEGKSGQQTFEVENNVSNLLKGVLYGKYGTAEGSEFADENFGNKKSDDKKSEPSSIRGNSSTRKNQSIRRNQ